jgi:hypothetical protein
MIRLAPPVTVRLAHRVPPKGNWQEAVALTGQSLGMFVLFYTSMNWIVYKRIREKKEKN